MSKKRKPLGYLACVRVGVNAFVDSYAAKNGGRRACCQKCQAEVWQSPSTQKVPRLTLICNECTEKKLAQPNSLILAALPGFNEEIDRMSAAYRERN